MEGDGPVHPMDAMKYFAIADQDEANVIIVTRRPMDEQSRARLKLALAEVMTQFMAGTGYVTVHYIVQVEVMEGGGNGAVD